MISDPQREGAQKLRIAGMRNRDRANVHSREAAAAVSEIGPCPDVVKPRRRAACRSSLRKFLRTYFPNTTGLYPFSDDHQRVISRIQHCVLKGGRFINCVYRGFGKTTISQNAVIWATLYGHRRFVCFFSSQKDLAIANLSSIKTELETNELLLEDFPEICFPISKLEFIVARTRSQTCEGVNTHMVWTAEKMVLPYLPGAIGGGAIILAQGLQSASRGTNHKCKRTNKQLRPDIAIVDDPQTDESAMSDAQVKKRIGLIKRNIMQMGGHQETMACVINATVIEEHDLVDQLLDSSANPAWQGERIKMVHKWADRHDDLWLKEYADIRNTYDRNAPGDQLRAWKDATKFYRKNRSKMDRGCEISWRHCYNRDIEISAVQHAYNKLIDYGDEVFSSEFQSDPTRRGKDSQMLTPQEITRKTHGYLRRIVPSDCHKATAFIDVQQNVLFYSIIAWKQDFTGYCIDYGSYPRQPNLYYTLVDMRRSLAKEKPRAGVEGRLMYGLTQLADELLAAPLRKDDESLLDINLCLIDAQFQTRLVYQFIAESEHRARLMPSHGKYYGAATVPINDPKFVRKGRKEGTLIGDAWFVPRPERNEIRHVTYDTNHWKSFMHARLSTTYGDAGSLSLFNAEPNEHRMIADHLTAEYPVRVQGRGREMDEWKLRPGRPDNHFLDCMVGACVAGSIQGVSIVGEKPQGRRARKKVSLVSARA